MADALKNDFKRRLKQDRTLIGLWSSLASPMTADIIADAGFDWIVLDCEHAINDPASLLPQLVALDAGSAHPVVRVAWNDPVELKRVLDIGAQTVLVPMVNSALEAEAAVRACRYPPEGIRGVASSVRANRYGRVLGYHQQANQEICLIVQVETAQALENLDAIAAVEGVDGVFIGPSDLCANLGLLGQARDPKVVQTIEESFARITAAGKPAGILTSVEEDARHWINLGFRFVAVGSDVGLLATQSSALAARFKG